MRKTLIVALVAALSGGCGAIFNGSTSRVNGPPGTTIDGMPVPITVSNKFGHEVRLPDGAICYVRSSISAGYLILDLISLTLIPLAVDAVTGDWNTLDGVGCPVSIE